MKAIEWFLKDGSLLARLIRTVFEVILAFVLSNIGDITGLFVVDGEIKTLLVGLLTLILTAVIGVINENKAEKGEEADG